METLQSEPIQELIQCQQWFKQVFEAGWFAIEDFFHPTLVQTEPAFRGCLATDSTWIPPTPPTNGVMGAKLLETAGQQIALCVGLSQNPREDGEVNISVELYPVNGDGVLPENTTLSVLDATGKVVVESRPVCDVAYKFIGESGEQFSVRISLGYGKEFGFLETFLI